MLRSERRPPVTSARRRWFGRILPLFVIVLAGCGTTQVVDRTPDGRTILVRSPQPDYQALLEMHRDYGIKTVVNLRGEHPCRGWFESEAAAVGIIGAEWVHFPISSRRGLSPEECDRFFEIVENPANWPILIHCEGGIHRTGLLCALYRMQYEGWTPAAALEELEDNWFGWGTTDRQAAKDWVSTYVAVPGRFLPGSKAETASTASKGSRGTR